MVTSALASEPTPLEAVSWRSISSNAFLSAAVKAAAAALLDQDPDPKQVVTRPSLLAMGGVPPLPRDATERDRNRYNPRVAEFFSRLTHEVLDRSGRYLEPVRCEGFRLLAKEDSHRGVEQRTDRETELALGKGLRRMKTLPKHTPNPEVRQRIVDSIASRGSLLSAVRSVRKGLDLSDPSLITNPTPTSFRNRS